MCDGAWVEAGSDVGQAEGSVVLQDQDGDELAGLQLLFEMGMIYFDDGVVSK